MIAGKVLQDRHSPDGVRDETEQSLIDTEALIRRWHGQDRLGYAITPRFAPSCSEAQLRGAGELAAQYPDVWIQSHVAENKDEIRWARELFPASRSYLSIYAGLRPDARARHLRALHPFRRRRPRADARHRRGGGGEPHQQPVPGQRLLRLRRRATASASSYGLASDVGGGTSFSPFHTMLAAYYVGREGQTKPGVSLSPQNLWWQHTAGAAQALGLEGVVGNLQPGCEADFVVLDPQGDAAAGAQDRAGARPGRTAVLADRAGRRPGDRPHGHRR